MIEDFHRYVIQPREAGEETLRLFKECRYREARELALKTIELYTYNKPISFKPLKRAVDFVTKRVRGLFLVVLGDIESALGNLPEAGEYYRQALKVSEQNADPDTTIKALQGLGTYHWSLGDFQEALKHCHQALDLLDGRKDRWWTRCKTLSTLGVLYIEVGHYEKALDFLLEAVEVSSRQKDKRALAVCLNNLATGYSGQEQYDRAIEILEQAIDVSKEQGFQIQEQQALICNNLGMAYLKRSPSPADLDLALRYFDESIAMSHEIGHRNLEAVATGNSGVVFQLAGRVDEAHTAFLKSLHVSRKTGSRAEIATALTYLGRHLKDDLGDFEGASEACAEAIDLIEEMRGFLRREIHRMGFTEQRIEPYEIMVECLLSLGRPEKALEYAERSKSRSFLELLVGELTAGISGKVDRQVCHEILSLLHEIDELRRTLERLNQVDEMPEEWERSEVRGEDRDRFSEALMDQLASKELALEELFPELTVVDPDLASLLRVVPFSFDQLLEAVDEDTAMVELYQTEKKLQIFIASKTLPLTAVTLDFPPEQAADAVWDLFVSLRDTKRLDIRSHDYIRGVKQPLTRFFELLIEPLKPYLRDHKRLLIIPHLFWHYLPFHALYDKTEKRYLCDQFELGYCPSASVLNLCRQKRRFGRDRALIFSRSDGSLPNVDREADMLAAAFYPDVDVFKGEEAYLKRIQENRFPSDVIHFACHGEFNQDRPLLSGIEIPPEKGGERRTYLLDFFQLRLDCSLVTLSACESGLSLFTSADELIGLSRALFYAGAASVILSLWRVSDASTCQLMENFYWHFAKNRQTKTRSLQLAMQAVKAKKEYAHPYYWAPFVVMGDWR